MLNNENQLLSRCVLERKNTCLDLTNSAGGPTRVRWALWPGGYRRQIPRLIKRLRRTPIAAILYSTSIGRVLARMHGTGQIV